MRHIYIIVQQTEVLIEFRHLEEKNQIELRCPALLRIRLALAVCLRAGLDGIAIKSCRLYVANIFAMSDEEKGHVV